MELEHSSLFSSEKSECMQICMCAKSECMWAGEQSMRTREEMDTKETLEDSGL